MGKPIPIDGNNGLLTFLAIIWSKIPTGLLIFITWTGWILCGSSFYAIRNQNGWAKGFYMAVSVGYSIGSSFIAGALGYWGSTMIESSKTWHVAALSEDKMKNGATLKKRWSHWYRLNYGKLNVVIAWLLWIFMMSAWSIHAIKWSIVDAVYFAVSSISTGGLWRIPDDSPDHDFSIAGFTSAVGVPLMALAMSCIVSMGISFGPDTADDAREVLAQKVSAAELKMMKRFGLARSAGRVDKAEFILLSALRLKALSPELVQVIQERFDDLTASSVSSSNRNSTGTLMGSEDDENTTTVTGVALSYDDILEAGPGDDSAVVELSVTSRAPAAVAARTIARTGSVEDL